MPTSNSRTKFLITQLDLRDGGDRLPVCFVGSEIDRFKRFVARLDLPVIESDAQAEVKLSEEPACRPGAEQTPPKRVWLDLLDEGAPIAQLVDARNGARVEHFINRCRHTEACSP